MQLALECPSAYSYDLIPLTDFNFLLTHLILENEEYRDYYTDSNRLNRLPFTVLDNSVNELGQPCTLQQIDEAAGITNPDVIIPPDFLGDGIKTLDTLLEGIGLWGKDKIWPVVQGRDREEVSKCAEILITMGFKTICVPYDITLNRTYSLRDLSYARSSIVKDLSVLDPKIKIHLLGFNTFEEIDGYKFMYETVTSIDTGSPYTNARHSKRMSVDELVPKGVYIDYSDSYDELIAKGTLLNLAYIRKRFNSVVAEVGVGV